MISCIPKASLCSSELGSRTFSPHKKYFGMEENVDGDVGCDCQGGDVQVGCGGGGEGNVQGEMSLNL